MKLDYKKIKILRDSARLTQGQLAKEIGYNQATISKWERGVITNLPIEAIEKLARFYRVDMSEFFAFDGSEKCLTKMMAQGRMRLRLLSLFPTIEIYFEAIDRAIDNEDFNLLLANMNSMMAEIRKILKASGKISEGKLVPIIQATHKSYKIK